MQLQKKWLVELKALAGKVYNIDKNFSSQPFSGISWGASASLRYQNNKVSHELEVLYATGALKPVDHSITSNQAFFNVDYINLYKIGSAINSTITCKAGGSIDILYVKRAYDDFINNSSSFEFAASAGGAFEINWFGRNAFEGFSVTDKINIPFISALIQPAFGDEKPGESQSARVASFSSFFRVKNRLSLEKSLSGRQAISLGYAWDFYQVLTDREVRQAYHQLIFTYRFIL